jgi:hypothetical protein
MQMIFPAAHETPSTTHCRLRCSNRGSVFAKHHLVLVAGVCLPGERLIARPLDRFDGGAGRAFLIGVEIDADICASAIAPALPMPELAPVTSAFCPTGSFGGAG